MDSLQKQLNTDHKKDAEDCIKIYDYLKKQTGGVWESEWTPLTNVTFPYRYPNNTRIHKPSSLGYMILKGLESKQLNTEPCV